MASPGFGARGERWGRQTRDWDAEGRWLVKESPAALGLKHAQQGSIRAEPRAVENKNDFSAFYSVI